MNIDLNALRTVRPLDRNTLDSMHTGSLLSRLNALRELQQSFEMSDWSEEETRAVEAAGLIAFKDSLIWREAYAMLKEVLSDREHMPRGGEERRRGRKS